MDKDKGQVGDTIGGISDQAMEYGKFQPWTIRGGVGNIGADENGMRFGLNDQMKRYSNNMFGDGRNLLNRSMQDPMAREQQLYDRMREIQAPGERRAMQNMQQNMFSQGRTGMGSQEYGGSPEQHAYYKAMGESQNSAMMNATQQAMAEQQQQYNMGMGMSQQGFAPYDYLMKQANMGLNNQQLVQNANQNQASLFAQLGLGAEGMKLNYGNLQTKMIGDMINAASGMAGNAGAYLDNWGSNGTQKFLESIGIG